MRKYAEFVIKFRIAIIIITIGITGWLGYQASTLTINSDILSYLPQDKESVKIFNEVGKIFGGSSMGVIAFEAEDGDIFDSSTLKTVRNLTGEYEKIEGVRNVISITNILDIKKIEGGLEIGKLIPPDQIPETKKELDSLKRYTLSKDMYSGSLVSADGKYTAVMIRLEEGVDRAVVGRFLRDATEEFKGDLISYYAGLPLWMVFINDIIFEDMGLLIPLVAFLVMITLFLSFRTIRGVLLPLGTVLFSTTWAIGLMAVFGADLTLVSNGMPVLLIAIGSAYGIHMLNKYNEVVGGGGESPDKGLKRAIAEVGLPIILAGVTTLAGFLSFTTSYLTLIREFGIFTAIGVLCALLLATTFLPAVLSLLKPRGVRADRFSGKITLGMRLMSGLGSMVTRHPRLTLSGAALIAVAAGLGLTNIKRSVNMVEYFEEGSEIRIAEEMMEEQFGGAMVVQIRVRGPIKDPFVLKEMLRIGKYLDTLPHVSNSQSVADLVCEMNQQMNGRYSIPDSAAGVGNLWMLLEGNEIMDQLVTPDEKEAVIQATVGTVDSGELMKLVGIVNTFIDSEVLEKWNVVALKAGDKPSGELEKKNRKQLVERVVEMVSYDVAARLGNDHNSLGSIEETIRLAASRKISLGDKSHILGSVKEIMSYLKGDESELEIDSAEILARLRAGTSQLLAGERFSLIDVKALIQKELPAEAIEEDPELAGDMAASLVRLMDDRAESLRIEAILSRLISSLPNDLQSDDWLVDDLNGDLWELNDSRVAVEQTDNPAVSSTEISLAVTGMPSIYKELDESLITSQWRSLMIAVLIVFLLVALQFRSLWAGTIAVIPILFTVLFNFGLMGYFGIPLDITTMMIASVAVGIGVDYAIHFLSRLRIERQAGQTIEESSLETMKTTGIAITINALAVSMGFIALMFGSVVPMHNFGWMTALTMIVSATSAMILIPSILVLAKRGKFLTRRGKGTGRCWPKRAFSWTAFKRRRSMSNATFDEELNET